MHGQRGAEDYDQIRGRDKVDVVEELARELFAKEDDFGLDETAAGSVEAAGNGFVLDVDEHLVFWVRGLAVDAGLAGWC